MISISALQRVYKPIASAQVGKPCRVSPLKTGLAASYAWRTSRKTAGLVTLRESRVNAAGTLPLLVT